MCSDPVGPDADLSALIGDMFDTLYASYGRGLAAVQIGEMRRVFIMDATWKDGAKTPMVFVNPEVMETSAEEMCNDEACLSIPGPSTAITRPREVKLRWQDETGQDREQWFTGFEAVCVQHEFDHLNGIVTLDHLSGDARAQALQSYQEGG